MADHNKTVLIIDDSPIIVARVRAMLEGMPLAATVMQAGSYAEAFPLLESQRPGIVLLDINIPGRNGLEVLSELRLVRGTSLPPVLILTAYDSVTAAMEAARRGAVGFLSKPITPDALRDAVHNAIIQSQSAAEGDQGENYLG